MISDSNTIKLLKDPYGDFLIYYGECKNNFCEVMSYLDYDFGPTIVTKNMIKGYIDDCQVIFDYGIPFYTKTKIKLEKENKMEDPYENGLVNGVYYSFYSELYFKNYMKGHTDNIEYYRHLCINFRCEFFDREEDEYKYVDIPAYKIYNKPSDFNEFNSDELLIKSNPSSKKLDNILNDLVSVGCYVKGPNFSRIPEDCDIRCNFFREPKIEPKPFDDVKYERCRRNKHFYDSFFNWDEEHRTYYLRYGTILYTYPKHTYANYNFGSAYSTYYIVLDKRYSDRGYYEYLIKALHKKEDAFWFRYDNDDKFAVLR